MKTKINLGKRDYIVLGITLFAGFFLGWLFFHGAQEETRLAQVNEDHVHEKKTVWTCSMHPEIRMDKPGKCPICGMDLIPLQENAGSEDAISTDEIKMTDAAMKIADIQTITVKKAYPDKEVYLLGKVKPDERNIAKLTARFGGRIEKLYVNFTGQKVSKGERLVTIYSPALVTAQEELLEAQDYKYSNPEFYKSARNKLKLWDLTDEQVDNIEQKGETQSYFDVLSPITGTVTKRNIALGDYVKEGSTLFQVIDLTRIWVMFEAYESDIPWIKTGDRVDFTIQSLPGGKFTARVSFIDPLIDPKTRIAEVRVEIPNPDLKLKPEMFASGMVTSAIAGNKKDLMIPKTSVLWTGKRAVVYVKVPGHEQPVFKYREIILGPSAGESYVVKKGLQEGEEIAVNGVFKIDAAAQLAGKPSMMNPEDGKVATGHDHNELKMNNGSEKNNASYIEKSKTSDNINVKAGHDEAPPEDQSTEINPAFRNQLTEVYQAYLLMKNAFVESNPHLAAQQAEKVSDALKKVDMRLLTGKSNIDWMNLTLTMKKGLSSIIKNHELNIQREAFSIFNITFYKIIKQYGLSDVLTYYQYCPMAFNGNGAYWLSETKEISNPYFGDEMLKCGDTKEILKY
jgi:Cu(I)/Ag(I) efflux system membrane fusion protein